MAKKLTEQQKIGAMMTVEDLRALAFFHGVMLSYIRMDEIIAKNDVKRIK